MNISLNPEIQSYLEEQVKAGRFAVGLDELDRGEVDDWDPADLKRRVRARIEANKRVG